MSAVPITLNVASYRDALYKSDVVGETTFQNEDSLPSLPLPSLQQTLNYYLSTVKPHVTEEEYVNTEQLVRNFENGIGPILQEKLAQRAKTRRNWVNLILYSLTIYINFIFFYSLRGGGKMLPTCKFAAHSFRYKI